MCDYAACLDMVFRLQLRGVPGHGIRRKLCGVPGHGLPDPQLRLKLRGVPRIPDPKEVTTTLDTRITKEMSWTVWHVAVGR